MIRSMLRYGRLFGMLLLPLSLFFGGCSERPQAKSEIAEDAIPVLMQEDWTITDSIQLLPLQPIGEPRHFQSNNEILGDSHRNVYIEPVMLEMEDPE